MYDVQLAGDDVAAAIEALPAHLLTEFNPSGFRPTSVGPGGQANVLFGIIERDRQVTIIQVMFF